MEKDFHKGCIFCPKAKWSCAIHCRKPKFAAKFTPLMQGRTLHIVPIYIDDSMDDRFTWSDIFHILEIASQGHAIERHKPLPN